MIIHPNVIVCSKCCGTKCMMIHRSMKGENNNKKVPGAPISSHRYVVIFFFCEIRYKVTPLRCLNDNHNNLKKIRTYLFFFVDRSMSQLLRLAPFRRCHFHTYHLIPIIQTIRKMIIWTNFWKTYHY